ncbi:MAG: GTP-binding protein, partial [Candidatus Omnitrophota bacterium]
MAGSTKDIRNVVVLSHSGEGKTTLVENLLYKGGAISKPGSVDAGTTVSDYNDDEKERKTSINLSVSYYEKDGVKVNLLDAPGYLDYIGDVIAGIGAADAFVLLVDAVSGVQVGTAKFWKLAQAKNLPGMIIINKMDKENADFAKAMDDIRNKLGKNCVALYYPAGKGASFSSIANLLTKEGIDKLQGEDKEKADKLSSEMTEGVAESDDALLEKYLEEGTLPAEDLNKALRVGVVSGKIIPVIPASIGKNIGVDQIMSMIKGYMPSPIDRPALEAEPVSGGDEKVIVEPKAEGAFSAQVFKTISDPFAGQISIFRVRSGKVSSNQSVKNTSKESVEKLGQLFFLKGKEQIQTDSVISGDIVAVAKLKDTETNDTLAEDKNPVKFSAIEFPEPAVSFSIKPKSRADEDKISNVLVKLSAEDPAFLTTRDAQTHEMI